MSRCRCWLTSCLLLSRQVASTNSIIIITIRHSTIIIAFRMMIRVEVAIILPRRCYIMNWFPFVTIDVYDQHIALIVFYSKMVNNMIGSVQWLTSTWKRFCCEQCHFFGVILFSRFSSWFCARCTNPTYIIHKYCSKWSLLFYFISLFCIIVKLNNHSFTWFEWNGREGKPFKMIQNSTVNVNWNWAWNKPSLKFITIFANTGCRSTLQTKHSIHHKNSVQAKCIVR